jgi:hypothetical protein
MRQIPKQFDILGHTVEVVFRDDLADDCECDGRFIASKNRIELQSGQAFSYTLATFWHEAMHAIATHMGMTDINDNEEQIDKLGQGVAQILKTKKGKATGA